MMHYLVTATTDIEVRSGIRESEQAAPQGAGSAAPKVDEAERSGAESTSPPLGRGRGGFGNGERVTLLPC